MKQSVLALLLATSVQACDPSKPDYYTCMLSYANPPTWTAPTPTTGAACGAGLITNPLT